MKMSFDKWYEGLVGMCEFFKCSREFSPSEIEVWKTWHEAGCSPLQALLNVAWRQSLKAQPKENKL